MKRKYDFYSMQILVTTATVNEIALFTNTSANVDVLITGVGVPSTMYHLQKRLHQVDYDLVIQAGIGGAFTTDLYLSETVLIKQDTFGDLGAEEKNIFTPFFNTALIGANEFPFTDGWLLTTTTLPENTNLKKVKAVTVNKVTDNLLHKQQLLDVFDAQIESMEGAALHYICLQENMPFLQLRSVSNYVGERDKAKWKMKEAIENLNSELSMLIKQLMLLSRKGE
jgi:futalosine hydrolase